MIATPHGRAARPVVDVVLFDGRPLGGRSPRQEHESREGRSPC
jgi:hypothetical protein